MKRLLLVVSALVLLILAAEAKPLSAWRRIASRPNPDARTTFTFALKQKNLDVLEARVLDISDPESPNYSNWMTREQILDIIAPPAEVPLKFVAWVEEECAAFPKKIENLGDAIKVTTSVACAEQLLNIKMAVYEHKKSGIKVVRRHLEGRLPTIHPDLAEYVEFVSGISQLPVVRNKKAAPVVGDADYVFDFVIPATARTLYSIPAGAKATSPRNSQSAIEFSPEGAPMISDMVMFAQQASETFTNISKIVGPFDVGNNGESILDVEYLTTIGAGAYTWYITIEGWIYDFALTLFNTPSPPLVNSVSYGWPEEDQCNSVTNSNCTGITTGQYVAKANAELLKVAGLGLSVLVASQDEGAPSEANEGCELDDSHPLWPIYPAASPWVTAVSGTTLIGGNAIVSNPPQICQQGYTCGSGVGAIEHPCMPNETYYQWTTGGGFSKYAVRPSWQAAAVNSYLSSSALIPPNQWFNRNNRGYPDISALGARILTIQEGSLAITAGTSAATPIIAGIITLLNDARLNQGKKQLGFLNPMLYTAARVAPNSFRYINAGNNKGTIGTVCTYGYGCWNGWSPVTGLGTPVYNNLLSYVKSLP